MFRAVEKIKMISESEPTLARLSIVGQFVTFLSCRVGNFDVQDVYIIQCRVLHVSGEAASLQPSRPVSHRFRCVDTLPKEAGTRRYILAYIHTCIHPVLFIYMHI